MNSRLRLFENVRLFSSIMVALALVVSIISKKYFGELDITWQLFIALGALAIGIPHGALDHLVTLPKANPLKMAAFVALYLLIFFVAVSFLLKWNLIGFQLVLLMSLLHFGIGDAAFLTELNQLKGIPKRKFSVIPIFLAFGAVPVLIPLLNSKSSVALKEINPNLIYWDQNFARVLWVVLSILIAIAILTLILTKRVRDLIDLFLLLALAILTPPLISFAIYFGCWHAMRHTARLTLVLPKSNEEFKLNRPLNAFWAAVLPGTPALLFTFLAAIYLWQRESIENSLLWSMLVIVWALTVPHMMVTARLDKAALA